MDKNEIQCEKSRIIVKKRGKQDTRLHFKIYKNVTPTVTEQPIECQGKVNDKLGRQSEHKCQSAATETRLGIIDICNFPGKYKALCFKHGILPRLL